MRLIFITLAFFNVVAFAWGLVYASDPTRPAAPAKSSKNPFQGLPEIYLISEIGDAAAIVNSVDVSESVSVVDDVSDVSVEEPEKINPEDTAPEESPQNVLCEMVGPFAEDQFAQDFVERLAAIEVGASVRALELPAGPGYWVYLSPQSSRRDALRLLSELQAKRIDSYVIPKGDLANGISLGMFSKKSLSEARLNEMQAIGLEPKVEEIERTFRETWVMIASGEDSKMSSLTWERLLEGTKVLERRQNYCLDVASQ